MNTDLKTAAAYIRVSTDSQTELSPDSQLKTVREYAKKNGYIIPNEYVFRDDGISGRYADKRPEFNRMIATAKQKPSPFCAVLLWKFSRFARNQEESIFYKSMLRKNDVEVISVSEPIIDGVFGSLIERIIEWSDEYYSIRLSGEVKRGMTERVERGGAVSIPSFGYNIENKRYVINPRTAPIVRQIFTDYLNGIPIIQIARQLNDRKIPTTRGNLWENRTVEYILYNPVYIGKIRWNPKRRTRRDYDDPDIMIVDGAHEPIIDEETFNKVQLRLAEQKRTYLPHVRKQAFQPFMLHGLVKCSSCGSTLSMSQKGVGIQCVSYIHGKCKESHYISIKKINEMVISAIEVAFKTGTINLNVKAPHKQRNEQTEPEIRALINKEQNKFNRIREAYENGVYTIEELKAAKAQTDEILSEYYNSINELKSSDRQNEFINTLISQKQDIIPLLKTSNITEEEKNVILRSFIDKIIFDRASSSIQIIYYI